MLVKLSTRFDSLEFRDGGKLDPGFGLRSLLLIHMEQ